MTSISMLLRRMLPMVAALLIFAGLAQAQCPAVVGADSGCGVLLTILDIGNGKGACSATNCVTIQNLQGPYDGSDDTLVGVVNNSKIPISSIQLTSSNPIFGFDGDGLCTYITCSWPHPTGYEGPGTSFNVTSDTLGVVNFNPPIPASGGTAYFSLEASLSGATACTSVINNSVQYSLLSGGKGISATFTSNKNLNYTLASAAQLCGFTDWDWQQMVTEDPCHDVFEAGSNVALKAPPSYNDPPLKGYSYQIPPNAVQVPVYWNPYTSAGTVTNPGGALLSLADHKPTANTMNFIDYPTDPCLSGSTDGSGKKLSFTTHLVGLVGALPGVGVQDTGIGFSYYTTSNGNTGGIAVRNGTTPPDNGTGGITVTQTSNTSPYQYPKSFGVSGINGTSNVTSSPNPPVVLGATQVRVATSGLAYSRATQTFNGTVMITNITAAALSGPFQVVFDSLPAGVTLTNATSTFGGWPYITIPATLGAGQSASISIRFTSNVAINANPVVYAGSFN